ncbi:unnamed protein product [Linum tenue]|uniref:Protein CHROMATIN REMODELING 8 n=1 Tax=Linum tenue TaxID=586396 RepID=A0AAV0HQ16_9ROSI|nr:unnamed protein product [Linum tenue]
MEDNDDKLLLRSLGVTSANPEDIERHVLAEAENHGKNSSDEGKNIDEEPHENSESVNPLSTSEATLYHKLRAVKYEIDAVASTVEQERKVVSEDDSACANDGTTDQQEEKNCGSSPLISSNDSTLQQALAADRLRSLRRTKAQIEKELSDLHQITVDKDGEHEKLLQDIVKERRPKKKPKSSKKTEKHEDKRKRTVSFADDNDFDAALDAASRGFVETERDELVRKGILTPFHKLKGFERRLQQPGPSNISENEEIGAGDLTSGSILRAAQSISDSVKARPRTKLLDPDELPKLDAPTLPFQRLKKPIRVPASLESDAEKSKASGKRKRPLPGQKWRKRISREEIPLDDAGDALVELATSSNEEELLDDSGDVDGTDCPFITLEGGLKVPDTIFSKLFDYQKVGVQWLWELHCQRAGGIIGDEMGLGKTIQVLSFLGALHFSNMYKPSIVICPVTLLRQWRREARKWYPSFHVELLHDSAHDLLSRKKRAKSFESDEDSDASFDSDNDASLASKKGNKWESLIDRVLKSESGLLITTYEQLRLLGDKLLDIDWGYAVLDEGHRIRNPNAEVTLVCKQLQTVHRIIMTGAPIQNRLSELWSLFDFVFPGKLGVLPVFEAEFAVPISVGGYANASPLQVSTAYRCAVVLRDLIMPYLLRRMKADVNAHLPKKTEHVLFCSLTSEQRSVYRAFLASAEVEQILNGSRNSLAGIDVMRKICNHPDLLEREHCYQNPDYGNPERSGKMKVVSQVLNVWKEQGHHVLLFTQTQQMLDILENFLVSHGYNYRRMDGLTPVKQRMALIDEFNNTDDIFIFILTTRVGGLGTNLTGADRVIIFDPDWNPSNDMQARERAWRVGQKRDVTVYRLITRGTIEEKVYHRQIYKHFLTNKILKNPQQRRFFKARDMKDLFILSDDGDGGSTETSNIFSQLSGDVNIVAAQMEKLDNHNQHTINGARHVVDERHNSEALLTRRKVKTEEVSDHKDPEDDKETNILKSLFDANGIHSALDHDAIVNAPDEEKMRLEEQASQVAQRAAEALRQSRMLRSRESISVPTWTGKSGCAGAPPSTTRQKFGCTVSSQLIIKKTSSNGSSSSNGTTSSGLNGIAAGASAAGKALSSAELLARIRGNQERAAGAAAGLHVAASSSSTSSTRSGGSGTSSVQPEVLIRQICTFIQQRGGSSDSATIVQHFKDRVPSKDLPLFKNLLKEIATLKDDPNGKVWVLKSEYEQ